MGAATNEVMEFFRNLEYNYSWRKVKK